MGSAKQARFVRAIEHDPKFAAKVGASPGAKFTDVAEGRLPLSTPGGVVASGGYLDGVVFKKTSLLPMRKR